MKKRPQLHKGDLVRINRRFKSEVDSALHDKLFRVYGFSLPDRITRRKLGENAYYSNDGALIVRVTDREGNRYHFKRRLLWRCPNRKRKANTGDVKEPNTVVTTIIIDPTYWDVHI